MQALTFDEALAAGRASTVFTTHTPVPAGIDRFETAQIQHFFEAGLAPDVPTGPDPGSRPGKLRRRQPVRLQHGRHGPAARAARQRRGQAARRGVPRHVLRALARIRPLRGAHHLRDQRRARSHLGGCADFQARPGTVRRGSGSQGPLGPRLQRQRRRRLGACAAKCVPRSWRTSGAGSARPGRSAVLRTPSSPGRTPCWIRTS